MSARRRSCDSSAERCAPSASAMSIQWRTRVRKSVVLELRSLRRAGSAGPRRSRRRSAGSPQHVRARGAARSARVQSSAASPTTGLRPQQPRDLVRRSAPPPGTSVRPTCTTPPPTGDRRPRTGCVARPRPRSSRPRPHAGGAGAPCPGTTRSAPTVVECGHPISSRRDVEHVFDHTPGVSTSAPAAETSTSEAAECDRRDAVVGALAQHQPGACLGRVDVLAEVLAVDLAPDEARRVDRPAPSVRSA